MPSKPDTDQTPDDIEVRGHKVFVTREGDWVEMQAVNDDRPHVSMTFRLGATDALEIAGMLTEAAKGDRWNVRSAVAEERAAKVLAFIEAQRPHPCPQPHKVPCEIWDDLTFVIEEMAARAQPAEPGTLVESFEKLPDDDGYVARCHLCPKLKWALSSWRALYELAFHYDRRHPGWTNGKN